MTCPAASVLARVDDLSWRVGTLALQEPRGGGQDALKKTMAVYYSAIQSGGGAVFFAVCRGKVGGPAGGRKGFGWTGWQQDKRNLWLQWAGMPLSWAAP